MAHVGAPSWLSETRRTYFGNATAVRDYRVQLRGSRSAVLFGIYLFILISVAMLIYASTAGQQMSIVEAQRQLSQFYNTVMILLASAISLVAPALSATTVVVERQRRSLDLVFSAPVSPRYYLVGKAISSYRYTWMLLVLALPVTATCVVLGGASWSDVLESYALLSLHALLLTSIALLISVVAVKPVNAVVYSYAAAIAYLVPTSMASGSAAFTSAMTRSGTNELPFFVTLNPFFVTQAAGSYTTISGLQVPNLVFAAVLILLVCKICLLGAGSMLSAYGAAETKSLRLHGLIYMWAIMLYIGWSMSGSSLGSTSASQVAGLTVAWILMPLFVILLPFLACFGYDGERKFWPNGAFSFRRILDGTPAGGLPYILALVLGSAVAHTLGVWWKSGNLLIGMPFSSLVLYTLGLWVFFWGVGRLASSWFTGLRSARTMVTATMVFFCALPAPFLRIVAPYAYDAADFNIWDFYPLRPLFSGSTERVGTALAWSAVMLLGGWVMSVAAERNVRRRTGSLGESGGRDLAAA